MHLQQLRGDADRVHVRELALLGAGADRRVALDVLDRAKPGADRAAHVGDGRVALEVDEHRVLVAVGQREGGASGRPSPVRLPTHSIPRSSPSGTGAPMRSSQRRRPRAWLQRWTRGLQPPETGVAPAGRPYRSKALASMSPGTSLSGKIAGRSIAPVASTIRFARIRQSRRPRSTAIA